MGSATQIDADQLPLLRRVRSATQNALLACSTCLEVAAGEELLTEGKPAGNLLFPLDRPVELYGRCGDRAATIMLNPPGVPFIMAAVVKDAPCLMSARTIKPTRLLFTPAARFRDYLHSDPALAIATAEELSRAFRAIVRQVRWQKLRTAKARLATYLLLQCEPCRGRTKIALTVSKRLLASMLGLEPESLSRSFTSLGAEGVHVNGDIIIIDDPEALRKIATYDFVIDAPET